MNWKSSLPTLKRALTTDVQRQTESEADDVLSSHPLGLSLAHHIAKILLKCRDLDFLVVWAAETLQLTPALCHRDSMVAAWLFAVFHVDFPWVGAHIDSSGHIA